MGKNLLLFFLVTIFLSIVVLAKVHASAPTCQERLMTMEKQLRDVELEVLQRHLLPWKMVLDLKHEVEEAKKTCQ